MLYNLIFLADLFSYLYCLAKFFGRKLEISIHAVVLFLLYMFILTGINHHDFPEYLRSLVYLGIFLYGLLYYGESVKVTLVNCFLSAVSVIIIQLSIYLVFYYIFDMNNDNGIIFELLSIIICLLLIMFLEKWIPLKRISEIFLKRNKLLILILIFVLIILGGTLYQREQGLGMVGANITQMIYFLSFTVFLIYEWQKSKADAEKKKMQLELNRLYYGAYDQLLMLVRERQHDMKNHLSAILSMIYTTNDYDILVAKQKEYCGYVLEQNEQTKLLLSTENPLIIGFVYSKLEEAKAKEIETEYRIKLISKELFLPEFELVDMIGILMDNAIEAMGDVSESERKINLTLLEREEGITLTVANTSNLDGEDMTTHFFETGYSSKGKNRGIGLSKLKRVVDRWNGTITVSNEIHNGNNYLAFEIYIPKEADSKGKLKSKQNRNS